MSKPSESWKKKRKHIDEVSAVLQDCGNMNRHGELIGWLGKRTHIKMQQAGHSSIDFKNCRCKND